LSVIAQLPQALREVESFERGWRRKPVLRELYHEFYELIAAWRSDAPGRDVELGSGRADYRKHQPGTFCCDLIPFPWLDFAADATRLPMADGSAANLTMIDVLHHLAYVRRFFSEVARVLAPGGRAILLEPYVSPMSWFVYRFLHPEPVDGRVRPLHVQRDAPVCDPHEALDGNQAIPTAIFWRDRRTFERQHPDLAIVHRQRLSLLLYPLTGGLRGPSLLPPRAVGLLRRVERALMPLSGLMAFRCLLVLEKRSHTPDPA